LNEGATVNIWQTLRVDDVKPTKDKLASTYLRICILRIICICIHRTWAHFCAILMNWPQIQIRLRIQIQRSPLVWAELLVVGHFQEIPMNHLTNRQAQKLGDLFGSPIGTVV